MALLGTAEVRRAPRTASRGRLLIDVVPPTARTIRWLALVAAAAAADLVLWAAKGELSRGVAVSLQPLRVAAVLLCLRAAFLLDDEAGATVEAAPTNLFFRRGVRLMIGIPAVGMAWGTALWIGSAFAASGASPSMHRSLPAAAITLEAAALLAVTLAAGAVATRRLGHDRGSIVAGPTLLAFILTVATFGRYWPLWLESPADPGWMAAQLRWAAILAVALIVLVAASLDPARRSVVVRGGPFR